MYSKCCIDSPQPNCEQPLFIDPRLDSLSSQSGFLAAFVRSTLPSTLKRFVGVSDVVQSIWLRVNQKSNILQDLNEHQFRNWILCMARRKIVDSLRRYHLTERTRTRSMHLVPSQTTHTQHTLEPEPLQLLTLHERADRLLDALADLPDEIQQIVILRYSEELTFQQIAQRLRLPVTTCRRRWLEGCELLRERLSDLL